jgi:peptidoglycan-associated lipoprotein
MKVKSILVAAVALVVLAGCAGKKPAPTPPEPVVEAPAPVVVPPPVVEVPRESEEEIARRALEEARRRLQGIMDRIMASDIYFEFDQHQLTAESRNTLNTVAAMLREEPKFTILVEGHTDERGTESYNLTLGAKRANAVREYLVNYGIAANRISTISYGEERPKAVGSDESSWALNRRAAFKVEYKE